MLGLLAKIWEGIKALPGLIFPFLGRVAILRGLSPWLRWSLHVLFLVLLLVGLAFLNYQFDVEKVLRAPSPLLRKLWLPLLFLLIYALGWLGWWLIHLLGPEEKTSTFPDIDAAWGQAIEALDKAGIDVTEAPLFLVVGRPRAPEEALFVASQLPLQVRHVPRRGDAPLHVSAGRDGIFITCAGASLLGRQAALLREDEADAAEEHEIVLPEPAPVPSAPQQRGTGPSLHWRALPGAEDPAKSTLTRKNKSAVLVPPGGAENLEGAPVRTRRHAVLLPDDEADVLTARLRHLCSLIVENRRPYCPINGLMLLVPWAATDTDADAQQTARLAQRDLNAIRDVLRCQAPVFAMVCDMEAAPGFRDLVSRVPEAQRQQRLGRSFPLVPDLPAAALPDMVQGGISWVCETLFPNLIYRLMVLDPRDKGPHSAAVDANVRLYQLLGEMRNRRHRLGDLVRRAVVREERGATLLGGCYFSGTGSDAARDQAFVAGVFPLLAQNQNFVTWTGEALDEESTIRRWTAYGYGGLGVLGAALLSAAYYFWPSR